MEILNGASEAHEKTTGRLFFQPHGEIGYIDTGNAADYKYNPERQTKTRAVSENGHRRVNDEQLDIIHERWEFTFDEMGPENEQIIRLATKGADVTQAALVAPAGTATITSSKKGRTYFVGKKNLNTVVVTVATVAKVEGTDYTVNLHTGAITILPGSSIADASVVDVTFGCAELVSNVYTGARAPLWRGAFKILETNQQSRIPLREIAFDGSMVCTSAPEQTGEFGKFVYRVTAATEPVITKRHAA